MELLGYPGITPDEESLILKRFDFLNYQPINTAIENMAIHLRRTHRLKLPDAIIAATALTLQAELLTYDRQLLSMLMNEQTANNQAQNTSLK